MLRYREGLYASPAVAALNSATAEVATITMNQSVPYLDLDRLGALAVMNAIAATALYPTHDFSSRLGIGGNSKLRGSTPLVVGRNTPFCAMNLSPLRSLARVIRWGRQPFQSQDTIAIEAKLEGTAITGDFSIAAPGATDIAAPVYAPTKAPQLLGSPYQDIAADDNADTITITADKAGWAYATALTAGGLNDAVAATEETGYSDGVAGCTLSSLTLPGNVELIRGSGSPEAPLAFFAADRHHNWVDIGWVYLSAGSTIVASVINRGTDACNVSLSVPFFEDDRGPGKGPC